MALFVHIAPEPRLKAILRNGIAPTAWSPDPTAHPDIDRVVWAFPVLESYTLTHSWSRELKRLGQTTLAAITFRISDGELVFGRHYREQPVLMPAAAAVAAIRAAQDARGHEVMIPRRIRPDEIVRGRVLAKTFGWRYAPHLKGTAPNACDCPFCVPRGEVNAARDRRRLWARMRAEGNEPDPRLAGGRRKKKVVHQEMHDPEISE